MKLFVSNQRVALTYLCLFVAFFMSATQAFAQRTVSGSVTDATANTPLVGVSIVAKGSSNGTITDVDGNFQLEVPEETSTITFSYIGYQTVDFAYNGQTAIEVVLTEDIETLGEVIVIGYGTGTKEKFNGAVSKIENDKLNTYAAANFDQAIAGTIAGVQISGNNKNPGENSVIQIRGLSTLTAGTNPLIVVDGNPLTEGSSLSAVNTQDIESINILKDAASAAIYGSRASNGVILITTKKGQEGRLQVTYDGYVGYQERIDKFELADAYGTAKFDYDARNFGYLSGGPGRTINDDNATRDANGGGKRSRIQPFLQSYLNGTPGLTNTNWEDAVLSNAPQQNHYLNMSGGTGKTDYSVSFGYFDADNIVVDSDYKRYTNNFQLNSNLNERIRFGISSNIAFSEANPTGYRGWSDFNLGAQPDPALAIILMHPYYPIYNQDGTLAVADQIQDNNDNWDGPISGNAVATAALTDYTENIFRFFGNTFLEIEPIEGLKFKTSFGGDYSTGTEEFFAPSILGNYRTPVANSRTMGFKSDTRRENFITENLLSYDKTFAQHTFNVLVGYSYQQEFFNRTRLESQDFTDDNLRDIAGATNPTATNASSKWTLESLFTRLQYDYASKYFVSASFRRDGSSRFGANTKYGDFASVSAGWTISQEDFFPKDGLVSFAKVRFSWGQTGNNQIGNFASIALIGQDNYTIDGGLVAGSFTSTSPNADLSWETNTSSNFGLDLGFLDNKILLTAEYYTSNTTDLLLNVPVPQQSGFSQSLQNIGELDNNGFELEIRGNHFRLGDVAVGFNANIFTTQNEVVALGNDQTQIISSNGGMGFITRVGEPIAQFYAYDILDVYRSQGQIENDPVTPLPGTEVGDYVVRDANGDGRITPDDRAFLGDYNPDFTYGFGFNAAYKGLDLNLQFTGVSGRKAADRMVYYTDSGEGFFVPSQYYVDNYFTDDNPNGFFRRPDFSSFSSAGRLTRASSLSVLDADYFRLRSLQVGYTFSKGLTESVGIQSLRLYITGNNIFNSTDFRGYNPDGIDSRSNTTQTLTRGWIQTTNPLTRFLAFGVNVKF
ncbi:MAG: TonB-dependent receptor [Saprospiraceae bacterium]|nr:TonB-dependent receptor [Saprospiraceae bacterium]